MIHVFKHSLMITCFVAVMMLVMYVLVDRWQLGDVVRSGRWLALGLAGLVGIIPESGDYNRPGRVQTAALWTRILPALVLLFSLTANAQAPRPGAASI